MAGDQRPRPQYGEYASTDERLAAGGLPLDDAPPRPETRIDPAVLKSPVPGPGAPAAYPWDRAITFGLLVFAGFTILNGFAGLLDFSTQIREVYEVTGATVYPSTALADGIGIAILASQLVLFAAVALISVSRLRAGKMTFFVPLIGGAVAGIITTVLVAVVMTDAPIPWAGLPS